MLVALVQDQVVDHGDAVGHLSPFRILLLEDIPLTDIREK
jgi:hypothetical protein